MKAGGVFGNLLRMGWLFPQLSSLLPWLPPCGRPSLWAHSSGSADQGTPVTRLQEGRIADVVRSVEGAAWEAPERRLNILSSLHFPLLEMTPATLT